MKLRECQIFTFRSLARITVFGCLLLLISCGQSREKHLAKGEEFLLKRKFQEAVMEFRAVADIDKDSAAAHWGLARAYENLEQFNDALDELRKTTALAPENLEAKTKLGNYYLVVQPPMITETQQLVDEVYARDPKYVEGYILKASMLAVQSRPEKEVLDVLSQAVTIDPKRAETYISLGRYYMKIEKAAEAEDAIKRGIAARPEAPNAYVEYGRFLTFAARPDEAELQFKKAIEVAPKNYDAHEAFAEFYVGRRQYDKAEAVYKELVTLQENSPESRVALADFYADAGRTDDAVNVLGQIIQEQPEYVRARYRLGTLYLGRREPAKVTEQIDALLKINDKDAEALLLRARLSLQNDDGAAAVKDLEDILKKLPSHREALYAMTEARLALGQTEQARAYIGDLDKYHPNFLRTGLLKIQAEFADGRADNALRLAGDLYNRTKGIVSDSQKMAREIAEIRFRSLSSRGLANLQLGMLEEAQADLSDVLKMAPKSATAMVNLARVMSAKKNFPEASRLYAAATAADGGNFDALSGTISLLQKQGLFAQAHSVIDQNIAKSGDRKDMQAALHYLKADTFIAEKNTDGAEAELKKSMESDESYLPAYSTYASMLVNRNQADAALAQFRAAVAKKPSAAVYTMIGMLEEANGNGAEAEKSYRKALDLAPDSPIAANNLAWMIADTGQGSLDEALRLMQNVTARNASVAGYFDTLGWVYLKKGLNSQAVEQMRKAIALDDEEIRRTGAKPNPGYRYRLGAALASVGDKASARREVETSLADGGNGLSPKEAQEAKNLLATL